MAERETEYTVTIGAQEFKLRRWSFTLQLQLNTIIWALTTGQENGQPVPAGLRQAYWNQVALATMGVNSMEELVSKYLGEVQPIKNLNELVNAILQHERRDWLASNGWSEAEIDKYYNADGSMREAAAEGENGENPQNGNAKVGGRTKRATSSTASPAPSV